MELLDNNYERREFIKLELEDVDIENPPIYFNTFQSGKFIFFLIFYSNLIIYLMACQTKNGARLLKAGYYSKWAGL